MDMKDCVLVATLGDSPGVVTTAMDALLSEGYRPVEVHCLALPGDNGQLQRPVDGSPLPLFRDDSDSDGGPQVRSGGRDLWNAAQRCGELGGKTWRQSYDWKPKIKWWVLNINSDDLTTEEDSFRFFQGCMEVLTEVQAAVDGSGGQLEGWLSLAGGRKSMAALVHTAAFFCGQSMRLCHVTVSPECTNLGAEQHWHPPAENRTFIELPSANRLTKVLPPHVRNALVDAIRAAPDFPSVNDRYDALVSEYERGMYERSG